ELAKDDDEETETGKGGDEVRESEGESKEEEETRQEEEESFDLIPKTSEKYSTSVHDPANDGGRPRGIEAYDADKAILDTYGDSTILKRRRDDDDQEGPSAGSNWGSKRQKEGGEHASASTPSEKATEGAGRSTTGRPPSSYRAWNTTLPAAQGDCQSWISDLARQTDALSSFNKLLDTPIDFSNFIMNRLNV
nr:hypothetical protein [Tanacetum cinerariifolium]